MFNIYGKTGCSSCTQAKEFLTSKGIEFNYLLLGKDYDLPKFMSFGVPHRSFPLIAEIVKGADEQSLEVYVGTFEDLKTYLK